MKAQADRIVSGDKHLVRLGECEGIMVLKAATLLEELAIEVDAIMQP